MLFAIGTVSAFITGVLTGLILGDSALDINVHDTYVVMGFGHLFLASSLLLGIFGLIYYSIFKLIDHSLAMLRWLHVFFIIVFILLGCVLLSFDGGGIASKYYDDSNVDLFSVMIRESMYLLSILSFVLAYITLVLNIILSFSLRLRNNIKRS